MKLVHKTWLVHEFDDETPEQILDWVKNNIYHNSSLLDKELWRLSEDKTKITHETMVSYTELTLQP